MTGEGGKLTGVYVSTDSNPAYGLSSPSQTLSTDSNPAYGLSSPSQTLSTDSNPAYGLSLSPSDMPQPRPATAAAPEETVYESGVF